MAAKRQKCKARQAAVVGSFERSRPRLSSESLPERRTASTKDSKVHENPWATFFSASTAATLLPAVTQIDLLGKALERSSLDLQIHGPITPASRCVSSLKIAKEERFSPEASDSQTIRWKPLSTNPAQGSFCCRVLDRKQAAPNSARKVRAFPATSPRLNRRKCALSPAKLVPDDLLY
eukprot:scaffold3867_cov254-Pinguiococcus_pyrenoidosus.AAC.8